MKNNIKKILTPLLLYFLSAILFYAHGQTSKSIQKMELAEISSGQRFALLIGNAKYKTFSPLTNPVNDARAMSKTLLKLGFKVELLVDASQKKMKKAIDRFGKQLKQARFGLFYYSGHGMQVDGLNYLIPVDAKINGESDVEYESVNAGRVLGKMKDSKNSMNLVILDACRNNPFVSSYKSVNPGLAIINAPTGTLIAYATAPGRVASDGNGSNGLYTGELLRHIKMPGLKLEEVFKKVRANVQTKSNGKQVPWESSSLIGDFYFVPPLKTTDSVQEIAKLEKDLKKLSEQKEKELKAEQQKLAILQRQLVDEQERLEEGNIFYHRLENGKWRWIEDGDQKKDSRYQGVFVNGEPNGLGTQSYINGNKYTGNWKDGKKHGPGSFTWMDGDKYEGQFKDGKRHGQGTYTYSSGDKYTGDWKDGKRDGIGSYIWNDGKVAIGKWEEDKFISDKTYAFPDSRKLEDNSRKITSENITKYGKEKKLISTNEQAGKKGPFYIVKLNDSLSIIAQKFNIFVEDLAEKNGIKNINLLEVGQKLIIPQAENKPKHFSKSKNNNPQKNEEESPGFLDASKKMWNGFTDTLKKINKLTREEIARQKLPEISQPTLDNMPTISPIKPVAEAGNKPELRLEELFPEEIKLKEPLQDLKTPGKTPLSKKEKTSDGNFLQRKKITQLASEEYNLHIRNQIVPKLGTYPTELFVRIELKIIASGKIIEYKVIAKSGSPSFDQAAELAVRNAVLDPLPQALARNPPYFVLIRIVPQN